MKRTDFSSLDLRRLITVVLLGLAMGCPRMTVRDAAVSPMGDRPECPHSPEFVIEEQVTDDDDDDDGDEIVRRTIREIPLSGAISDIPEFHDCQRLIVVNAAGVETYDSLYAIYTSDSLAFFTDTSLLDTLSAGPGDTAAVAAATIYSYGGTHRGLGIEPGFNCLYLAHRFAGWRAWMVPRGPNDPNCDRFDGDINDSPNRRLHVVPRWGGGPSGVPPVARWDWDNTDREQYIGIRCGSAWCEVSDDATTSEQAIPTNIEFGPTGGLTPDDGEKSRVRDVKGWYDAQRLAGRGPDGKLVPSNVWGVVVPHPTLHRQTIEMYEDQWVHVATMVVSGDYDGAVLSLKAGRQYKIYLCSGCTLPVRRPRCQTPAGAGRMWTRITYSTASGSEVSEYGCAIRRTPHNPSYPQIPGTSRWRWLANDETTWKRCADGCCEVQ